MATEAQTDIRALHDAYCRSTGMQIPLDMAREQAWFWVWKRGIRAADIILLVAFLRRQIAAEKRNPGCLKFRNLVGNPDYLEEDLAEARAIARRPVKDQGRADVLQASGRPSAAEPPPARHAGAILPPDEVSRRLREAMAEARKAIQ